MNANAIQRAASSRSARATGNVATEDIVYMLEGMGIATGIDRPALIATGLWLSSQLGRATSSRAARASA